MIPEPTRSFVLASLLSLISTLVPAEPIRLVSGEDYPPFASSSLAGGGVLTELVRQAFAASGTASSVDFKPWTRGYYETLRLEYSATFPYLLTPRRNAGFLFSDPLYHLQLRLYVHHDSPWQTGSEQELAAAIFCLPAGYEVSGWVRRKSHSLAFVQPRSMEQCHAMLQLGRVDVLVSNPDEIAWRAVAPHLIPPNLRKLPEPLADVTLHLIIPRAHPQAQHMMNDFNAGLRQLISSGARDRLFQEHPDLRPNARPNN